MRFAGSCWWRSVQLLCLAGSIVASSRERATAAVLVSSFGTNSVLEFDSTSGAFIRTFASGGGLVGPEGLAYGPDGNLYVATRDINNQGIGGVLEFNGSTGAFIGTVIAPSLYDPFGITFGPNGNLYVSTDGPVGVGGSPQVLEYSVNASGASLVATLQNGLTNPQANAQGIAFGPDGRLYLATDAGGVKVYDASAAKFETFAAAPSSSTNDYDLAFSGGHLFVTDFNEVVSGIAYGRVLEYDAATGAYQGVFADTYPTSGLLDRAAGIAVGPNGNLLVAGFNSSNVVQFDGATGQSLGEFISSGSGGLNTASYMVFQPAAVPEPASLLLWLAAAACSTLVCVARRAFGYASTQPG
jgi:WD40 repeat protein